MKLKKLATVAILAALLAALAACGGSVGGGVSPTGPTSCATGVNVILSVKYVRQQTAKPDSITTPTLFYRNLGQGPYINVDNQVKVDYYTWTTTISVSENAQHGGPHQISEADAALLPGLPTTATDIYVQGVLVAKSSDNTGQLGWFRVDGCGVVTATLY